MDNILEIKNLDLYFRADDEEYQVVKTKKFVVKPMDVQEAIMQMNLLNHNFFVYRDAETEDVNVVYRRDDGDYGLIESGT
jgi:putative sigma-54 modulation protein